LLALGPRQLPVVARGKEWVNGQSLKEIARFVGIDGESMRVANGQDKENRINATPDPRKKLIVKAVS